jgi:hypothetical protein
MFTFTLHECSNVCWVLAKLQLVPPKNGKEGMPSLWGEYW